jgi:hypothetical protein
MDIEKYLTVITKRYDIQIERLISSDPAADEIREDR